MFMLNRFSLFAFLTMFVLSENCAQAQSPQVVPDEIRVVWTCTVYGHCGDPDEMVIVPSYPKGSKEEALQNARDRARSVCTNFNETSNTCSQSLLKVKTTERTAVVQEPVYWDVLVKGITCSGKKIPSVLAYGPTFCDAYRMGKVKVCEEAKKQCEKVRCYCWQVISKPCCCNK